MDFGLTEEQQQLKDSARNFLSRECPTTRVREIMADDVGMPRDLYQQIANLGWNGLIVPEKFGGAGLGMLDMSVLLEGDALSRPPKGYDPGHPLIDDLKRKDFIAVTNLDLTDALSPLFIDRFTAACIAASPLMRFLTKALGLQF